MTILSARYGDETNQSVILQTVESGAVAIDLSQSTEWKTAWQEWEGNTSTFSAPVISPIDQAKTHVTSRFDGLELLTLKDWKDSAPAEITPKLQALYAWIQGIIATAAAGQTNFTEPPHAFSEVLAEISAL